MVTWHPGEHACVIGDTGTGKTFLMTRLVRYFPYIVVFKTKDDDRGGWKNERRKWPGFTYVRKADALNNLRLAHIYLSPVYEEQAREGARMLNLVWRQGGWCVAVDEHWYAEKIGLKFGIERLLTQGRSQDITMLMGMQRPVQVSRFALSQATHAFVFRIENRDAKIVAESLSDSILPYLERLKKYECVYFNRATRQVAITSADALPALLGRPLELRQEA